MLCCAVLCCDVASTAAAEEMLRNMDLLAALPLATHIYCGHEYTLANTTFLQSISPKLRSDTLQQAIDVYHRRAVELRGEDLPTVPSTIGDEVAYNLFAMCRERDVQRAVGCLGDPVAAMSALRELKNAF